VTPAQSMLTQPPVKVGIYGRAASMPTPFERHLLVLVPHRREVEKKGRFLPTASAC
jgi:hypothetical protein